MTHKVHTAKCNERIRVTVIMMYLSTSDFGTYPPLFFFSISFVPKNSPINNLFPALFLVNFNVIFDFPCFLYFNRIIVFSICCVLHFCQAAQRFLKIVAAIYFNWYFLFANENRYCAIFSSNILRFLLTTSTKGCLESFTHSSESIQRAVWAWHRVQILECKHSWWCGLWSHN